jgi:NADPH:quinone reductase-like Zn-dependent oxidoreductase
MKLYRLSQPSLTGLDLVDEPEPQPKPREVVVRIRATSLNYKDLLFVKAVEEGGIPLSRPTIPLSDAAGEIVELGPDVTRFAVGDRVAPVVVQDWFTGPLPADAMRRALGVGVDGVLSEFRAFDQNNLVSLPPSLSFEQGATLPIAAVTAWNAVEDVRPHQSVVVLGTGGVALFALQFAKASGARVIVITSRDEKADRAKALGADDTINYTRHPDWERAVLALTGGRGVDHVVETVGGSSVERSVKATAIGGSVYCIGLIDRGGIDPYNIQFRAVTVRGIRMGSRDQFETMNRLITQQVIQPAIDNVFAFTDVRAAYERIHSGQHVGKVVIAVD